MNEEAVKSHVKLAAAQSGLQLWRNQVGACYDQTGRLVRFGLANVSAQENRRIKSSDMIGITPLVIGPEHVGRLIGVFTALETKASDWRFTNDPHTIAQLNFINLVRAAGGYAGFINDPSQLGPIIGKVSS